MAHAKAKLKLEEQRRSAASEHLLDTKHQLQQAGSALAYMYPPLISFATLPSTPTYLTTSIPLLSIVPP